MTTPEEDLRRRALRRVKLKTGFYIHATVYVLVNLGLAVVNGVSGGKSWALWPLAGWGLGLAIHGIVVVLNLRGEGLRDSMVDKEIEKLKRQERG